MFENLVKTQPDWHLPINKNFAVAADKLVLKANCTYEAMENVYVLDILNIPSDIQSTLPQGLPDLFSVMARFPNAYTEGAAFRVGSVDFVTKYAGFEAGDVLTLNFDKAEQKCFFRVGGGKSATLAAYCGSAYAGIAYVG